jgi:hypothetical protein
MNSKPTFVEKAVEKGFKRVPLYNYQDDGRRLMYDPKSNWFGCNVHDPEIALSYGDDQKTIILSLGGMLTASAPVPNPYHAKMIKMFVGDKEVFCSWDGKVPDDDFIDKFLS